MRLPALLSLPAVALALAAPAAAIEPSLPQPLPIERQVPAARDIAYPGTIELAVDATDVARGIFRVRERLPVTGAGRLYLLYPQWLPGNHAPRGPIDDIADLTITANGQPLRWRRDPVDVYAIQVDVPEGARSIDLSFDYVSPTSGAQGRVVMTSDMLSLQWNLTAFYPAGYFTRRIMVSPSAILPAGWGYGTALEPAGARTAGTVAFRPVSFETLVDSPMLAGRHFRQIQLSPKVRLNIAGDDPAELQASEPQIRAHRLLVDQAVKLFGAEHYDHYDFLLSISDRLGGIGLEHQRSSENGVATGYFTRWDEQTARHNLLPHEYVHSWNGKYRRGADLYTPDYSVPMRNSLLWVYEGQTQYWGYVLQARSGLVSPEDTLAFLAMAAAQLDTRPGRQWRPLIDTTNDPIIAARRPQPWTSLQRSEDYYNEGMLVWLDVDMKLRELTGGRRSLDDFARAFFGMRDGDWGTLTYTLDDIVATLNAVAPHDWAAYLRDRVEQARPHAPLDWIAKGGYRLVYSNKPTNFWRIEERRRKLTDLSYSLGVVIDSGDRKIEQVIWDSPAFAAGLTNSDSIVALDGESFDGGKLAARIDGAVSSRKPIELLVRRGDQYRTVSIPYYGGNRYPRLEPTGTGAAWLDQLLKPKG
ncbi:MULTISPECIES: M61 family metallopeptidase [unclassified Sphingomonas]|uniref:M61 family metallopeptidase n=1 Tax=unclassified Sphingomonas TaxID=196159 RepID=UPI0006FF66DA|nr:MULTISPECIES: M61 family metallopeptidase [unclassified Sphingomonas]KQX20164.1 peptidase M61 [Sphingomonas sp. Root1294]KQY67414.1 peptidase M61 [Sphingomonas sp. Root50]KRB91346.1 peptidase M61 [Sphingomonas sp. Root720]